MATTKSRAGLQGAAAGRRAANADSDTTLGTGAIIKVSGKSASPANPTSNPEAKLMAIDLAALRPVNASAAAVQAAIARTEQAAAVTDTNVLEAKAKRDALLLAGSAADLRAADAALRESRDAGELVAAMLEQLHATLADAERNEMRATLNGMCRDIAAAKEAYARWYRATMPALLTQVRQGVDLHNAASVEVAAWARGCERFRERYPDAAELDQMPRTADAPDWIVLLDVELQRMATGDLAQSGTHGAFLAGEVEDADGTTETDATEAA